MTLPPSLVAAVREAKGCQRGPALSGAACCGDCAEAIARSVLRAALTGEAEGEWAIRPPDQRSFQLGWAVVATHRFVDNLNTEAEARAVANALHLLAALSGEEETR